jgi:hypothetical protein
LDLAIGRRCGAKERTDGGKGSGGRDHGQRFECRRSEQQGKTASHRKTSVVPPHADSIGPLDRNALPDPCPWLLHVHMSSHFAL